MKTETGTETKMIIGKRNGKIMTNDKNENVTYPSPSNVSVPSCRSAGLCDDDSCAERRAGSRPGARRRSAMRPRVRRPLGEQDTGAGVVRAMAFCSGLGWRGRGAGMSCSPCRQAGGRGGRREGLASRSSLSELTPGPNCALGVGGSRWRVDSCLGTPAPDSLALRIPDSHDHRSKSNDSSTLQEW
eukprot:gene14573-biopygen18644